MNKKCSQSAHNETRMFDTFSLNCSFEITNAIENTDGIASVDDPNGFFTCSVTEPINIYVSERQVSNDRNTFLIFLFCKL